MATDKAKSAFIPEDVDTLQYGKREYRLIDKSAVNMADFTQDLYEGQEHYGDVREYNAAKNSKHPDNDLTLDWASRKNTVFSTEAEGFVGKYTVTDLPTTAGGVIYIKATRWADTNSSLGAPREEKIPAHELGIVADPANNEFKQVVSKLIHRGVVNKETRERLTKVGPTSQ